MSAEAHTIPDDILRAANSLSVELRHHIAHSDIELIKNDVGFDLIIAKAVNDAVMAERERCAEICVARSKEHAASRHQWKDSDSVNLCLSDSIEALNCASAIRAAPKAEGK